MQVYYVTPSSRATNLKKRHSSLINTLTGEVKRIHII